MPELNTNIPVEKWRDKVVAYAVANLSADQIDTLYCGEVKNLIGDLEGHGLTDVICDYIKAEAKKELETIALNEKVSAIESFMLKDYPKVKFVPRRNKRGKKFWWIWPDGEPDWDAE